MFGSRKKRKANKMDTLVGSNTVVNGDLQFTGGLHVDGVVKGNVSADDGSSAVLTISDSGRVEGEVRVPHVILNGCVHGDVRASERIELAANGKVQGDVYYSLLEMAMGAEVNGSLVHLSQAKKAQAKAATSMSNTKPVSREVEKIVDKPVDKRVNKSVDKPVDKTTTEITGQPVDRAKTGSPNGENTVMTAKLEASPKTMVKTAPNAAETVAVPAKLINPAKAEEAQSQPAAASQDIKSGGTSS